MAAVAILAPLNLGGYEVSSESREYTNTTEQTDTSGMGHSALPADRLIRAARNLAPVYIILTVLLAILLIMSGEQPLLACIHAMSVLSTSGITGSKGLIGSPAGFLGEMLIFIFLIFAITRRSFTTGFNTSYVFRLGKDRELRLAAMAVIIVPLLLFLRHWIGSSDGLGDDSFGQAMRALWGGIFTVLSFLTTTGFISDDWSAAEIWSGLTTPGLVFVGLAITGGGVATTAGGIKLLRVYALYKHGAREIEKLSYPNSVAGSGRLGRRIRREGAYVAWVFFMLFIVSLAVVMVALGGVGLAFEDAMILAIAALSTTGPLADVAGQDPVSYLYISDAAKLILSIAMIVGRMETLVLIALINPTYWRM